VEWDEVVAGTGVGKGWTSPRGTPLRAVRGGPLPPPSSYVGTRESRERDGALARCRAGPSLSSSSWVLAVLAVLVVAARHRQSIGLR